MEPDIATYIGRLADSNVKITNSLIVKCALKISSHNGIVCGLPKAIDEFLTNLDPIDEKQLEEIVEGSLSNAELSDDGQIANKYTFIPTNNWLNKFCERWDWNWGEQHVREVNLTKVLSNLEVSLLFVYVMRRVCNIDGGKGLILNGDQSMWYRCYQTKKQYTEKK